MKPARWVKRFFLFASLCSLWWNCVCDISSNEIPRGSSGLGVESKNGPSPVSFSQEESSLTVEENVHLSADEVLKRAEVHNDEISVNSIDTKNKPLENPDVKVPKFSETVRKMRRRDTREQILKRKSKLLESDVPDQNSGSEEDIHNEQVHHSIENADFLTPIHNADEEDTANVKKSDSSESQEVSLHAGKQTAEPLLLESSESLKDGSQATSPDAVVPDGSVTKDVSESLQSTPPTKEESNLILPHHDQGQHPHSDAMPSFDEWKKMMLAEQEKGGHEVPSPGPPGKKLVSQKRRRNYASYECGAKIVSSNAEGEGNSRILNEMVDEYMLNPCKAKIWFIIELCETVQASQIELANFELFSSCPKDFAVYSSNNFPTRDWVPLGTFTAAEQRVLQNFHLKQEGFGKFIKIELLSHYGKEHYCPLSVVRIFGTSMVDDYEEMETMSSHHVPPEDELDRLDLPVEDKSSNIFGSATDAVYSIVKKAAQVLGQQQTVEGEEDNKTVEQNMSDSKNCKFVNNTCVQKNGTGEDVESTDFFKSATALRRSLFQHLQRCDQCVAVSRPSYYSVSQPQCRFFQAALGPVLFNTICDWFKDNLITLENAPDVDHYVGNISNKLAKPSSLPPTVISVVIDRNNSDSASLPGFSDRTPSLSTVQVIVSHDDTKLSVASKAAASIDVLEEIEPKATIKPTKTLSESGVDSRVDLSGAMKAKTSGTEIVIGDDTTTEGDNFIVRDVRPSKIPVVVASTSSEGFTEVSVVAEATAVPGPVNVTKVLPNVSVKTESDKDEHTALTNDSAVVDVPVIVTASDTTAEEFSDDLKSVEEKFSDVRESVATVSISGATVAQKESVFVRMNNRIKSLELNMSLSSQYLQELSQRYRRQMEEMQRAFNRTIGTLNDTARKAAEKDLKQQEVIGNLQSEVTNLTQAVDQLLEERSTVKQQTIEIHVFLMVVEAIIMTTILSLCVRRTSHARPQHVQPAVQSAVAPALPSDRRRRNSASSSSQSPSVKIQKRSASEEVILSGENLAIAGPSTATVLVPLKAKKRHKKKKGIRRCSSNPTMSPTKDSTTCSSIKEAKKDSCAAGIIFQYAKPKNTANERTVHACENCNKAALAYCSTRTNVLLSDKERKERTVSYEPLKNLTNGKINGITSSVSSQPSSSFRVLKEKDKFSFKKFLKLQKRESI